MADERWFYTDNADWAAVAERLKTTACPHCQAVGTLNRHGTLTGYSDAGPGRVVRGRRAFCSNRGRRPGCGQTVTVWAAGTIRRLSLTARTVGAFLRRGFAGTLAATGRDTDGPRTDHHSGTGRLGIATRLVRASVTSQSYQFSATATPDL